MTEETETVAKPSLKVEEIRENPLLNRREVLFTVFHEGAGTPDRWIIKKTIAEFLGVPVEHVIVKSLTTRARAWKTRGHAHVYDSKEELIKVEPRHLYIRNLPPEERAEALKALRGEKKGG
ncbi:MAG: 30S ribosomal protein S24e [Thermoprotei archaeon]|nr:MAG: 30S ribosomal protein S24e [Thermoprotei archaeon]